METSELQDLIAHAKRRTLARREFIRLLAGFGLTAPMAAQILMQAGIAQAAERMPYKPSRRGGGGTLKLLLWQGPTILNGHLSTGNKDVYGCRLFYQSLAEWDSEANLIPVLATAVPSVQDGTLDPGGRWVIWDLKRDVRWHDGAPFTADDIVFNQEYAGDPATNGVTTGIYQDVRVEKLGTHRVRVVFARPTPFWADAFVGRNGLMLPKRHFDAYRGARSREAPANLKPVGIGPYRFVSFVPGDLVRAMLNPDYHEPHRPFFDAVEMKGGGDAVSAARAVLQTGEFDYAWNLQVEDEILKRLESGGKGRVVILRTGNNEILQLNAADPWTEVEGERGHPKSRHALFADPAVREALALCVDRRSIQEHIYGRTAAVTANFLNAPQRFASGNLKWEFDVDKANRTLEAAGWKRGPEGVRAKDGRKLKLLFTTSVNAPRQKTQAIIKQACGKAGIDMELKAVPASVFFSADHGNPDTLSRFSADVALYGWTMGQPDPGYFMNVFCSWEVATKANKWSGRNSSRFQSEEYDRLHRAAEAELDPAKRAAMFIRMNDLVVGSGYIVPIVNRAQVIAVGRNIQAQFSAWASDIFLLQDWYRG